MTFIDDASITRNDPRGLTLTTMSAGSRYRTVTATVDRGYGVIYVSTASRRR